jgi:hypothetical protein
VRSNKKARKAKARPVIRKKINHLRIETSENPTMGDT